MAGNETNDKTGDKMAEKGKSDKVWDNMTEKE